MILGEESSDGAGVSVSGRDLPPRRGESGLLSMILVRSVLPPRKHTPTSVGSPDGCSLTSRGLSTPPCIPRTREIRTSFP